MCGADGFDPSEILGVLSLALWSLILVVTVKYVTFLMRADNHGEGGVLALAALARRALGRRSQIAIGAGRGGGGAVLRRCDHHARAVGAVRDGGAADDPVGGRDLRRSMRSER